MTTICFIAPAQTDEDAAEKAAIVLAEAEARSVEIIIPQFSTEFGRIELDNFKGDLNKVCGVLADVSFERPSVYYELGVAEALGIPCVLIARVGTAIHQSTYSRSVTYYESLTDFRSVLGHAISSLSTSRQQ
jgi:hypothetical protein